MPKKSKLPSKNEPHPIDVYLGTTLRQLRIERGMSQTDLARACDVTFQQIQKYELASNRISVSRLLQIAEILGVPISYFLGTPIHSPARKTDFHDLELDVRSIRTLLHDFSLIKKPKQRKMISELIKSMAGNPK